LFEIFFINIAYAFLISPLHAVCPTNLIIFHLIALTCCISVNDEAPHYMFSATSSFFFIFIRPDV